MRGAELEWRKKWRRPRLLIYSLWPCLFADRKFPTHLNAFPIHNMPRVTLATANFNIIPHVIGFRPTGLPWFIRLTFFMCLLVYANFEKLNFDWRTNMATSCTYYDDQQVVTYKIASAFKFSVHCGLQGREIYLKRSYYYDLFSNRGPSWFWIDWTSELT